MTTRPGMICMPRNTSSDASFALARQWIDECVHGHGGCPVAADVELPARVVDVGDGRPDGGSPPRLHVSTAGERGRYATLSYCWGWTTPEAVLLAESLDANVRRIDEAAMMRTVREVMQTTRRLGLRFLWVDAQCIMPDSAADWLREAAKMCDVYSNALVTIQAAAADDASKGCFVRAGGAEGGEGGDAGDAGDAGPARLRAVEAEAVTGGVDAAGEGVVWVCGSRSLHGLSDEAAPEPPVELRGWTLQEGLLSPRVLSFGPRYLSWQCRTTCRSEAGRPAVPDQSFLGLPKPI